MEWRTALVELREREAWSDLATAIRDALDNGAPDESERRELWNELAGILLDRDEDLEVVARMYEDNVGDKHAALVVWLTQARRDEKAIDEVARLATADDVDELSELAEELEDEKPLAAARVWRLVAKHDRSALAQAVRLDPDDTDTLAELRAHLRETARWKELAALLARSDNFVELGEVYEKLQQDGDAIAAYERAPDNMNAVASLLRLYRMREMWPQVADLLARDKNFVEVGALYESLGEPAEAISWYERARERDPEGRQVLAALQRLYRHRESWPQLAEIVPHLIATADSPSVELHAELAEVLDRADEVERAIAAYRVVLEMDANHKGALEALARLYERTERPQQAIDTLKRLVEQTRAPKARADLFQRIGHVHLASRDAVNARLHFVQALALDLDNAATREGMARVHLEQKELVAAGEEMVRAAALSSSADKVRRLHEAAKILTELNDARATHMLEQLLEIEPAHVEARRMLHDAKQWAVLWPHLEREAQSREPEAVLRAARAAVELGKKETALELYELAATSPETAIERAEALMRFEAYLDAATVYQSVVDHVETEQRIDVLGKLGRIYTTLADPPRAQEIYEKLLAIDPSHRATLDALVDLHIAGKRFEDATTKLRATLPLVSVEQQIVILERIGDLERDVAPAKAIAAYNEALGLDPKNRRLLQRALDLQSTSADWTGALETIAKFIACEADPVRRGLYHLAAAEIRRNELSDKARALTAYNHALDELFEVQPVSADVRTRGLDVFRTVAEIVAEDRNWAFLEECFHRMIGRLRPDDMALVVLWQTLGELYRVQLADFDRAIGAYEKAHALEADPSRAKILAELYGLRATTLEPNRPETVRARGRAALHAGKLDEAWCIARTLVYLDKADAEERALYAKYQAQETKKSAGSLEDDEWAMVRHPNEDRVISKIFALTWFGPAAATAKPPRAFDLKLKDRLAADDVLAKIFRYVARVLHVNLPDIYVHDRGGHLFFANCIDQNVLAPALIVGRDLSTKTDGFEVAAWAGALLALLCPPYVLRLTLPVEELEAAVAGAARLVGRDMGKPKLAPQRGRFAEAIHERLQGQVPDALHGLVAKLPVELDLVRWKNSVDMTARRAALLVCGKLATAAQLLAHDLDKTPDPRQLKDLVEYSVSPAYFAARGNLGVQIES